MLNELKAADNFEKFAAVLGYKPSGLSYILYKIPDRSKYEIFTIPKKSGGTRTILAPNEKLKALQARLAEVLQECNTEINHINPQQTLSHGFEKGHSIISNAWIHKNRRHVLNIDIEDFFPSINFGRIRGFFKGNRDYALPERAATYIAQIACFQGKLPQGSPCSPIISNLIGHLLDVKMANLAKKYKLSYSRYADDLTISTNQKEFPSEIASQLDGFPGSWVLGDQLLGLVNHAGFRINHSKTRMQCRPNRQLVTGLTVNKKVNIRADYYRKARKMCSALFNHGAYYTESPSPAESTEGIGEVSKPTMIRSPAVLEGILSHIYHVKQTQAIRSKVDVSSKDAKSNNKIKYPAHRNLYKKFLYFKNFIALEEPLILCEGKTDNIYLRSALKALDPAYPSLASVKNNKLFAKVKFLKHSRAEHDILELSGGCGNIANFITHYRGAIYNYKYRPLSHPIIIVVDNDSGPAAKGSVFPQAKRISGKSIELLT